VARTIAQMEERMMWKIRVRWDAEEAGGWGGEVGEFAVVRA
jgi:hypothetical protein